MLTYRKTGSEKTTRFRDETKRKPAAAGAISSARASFSDWTFRAAPPNPGFVEHRNHGDFPVTSHRPGRQHDGHREKVT